MMTEVVRWGAFHLLILFLILLDLGIFHRKKRSHASWKEALSWSCVWVGIALLFNGYVYWSMGAEKALEFFTGYLVEKSLSVDNLFVFIVIFTFFDVPLHYHHRVLFYGIAGACLFRLALILAGISLIELFHWVLYLFGILILVTGIRLIRQKMEAVDPEKNFLVRWIRSHFPITKKYHGGNFFVRLKGKMWVTPLFLVLVVVETSDILFALDSIPAIFAITLDPFIVYTSNVFAILGLRTLHFLVMHFYDRFHYLKVGLGAILVFIGAKMLLGSIIEVPLGISLAFVALVLAISMLASVRRQRSSKLHNRDRHL